MACRCHFTCDLMLLALEIAQHVRIHGIDFVYMELEARDALWSVLSPLILDDVVCMC